MNNLLKLRNCRYLFRRIYGDPFDYKFSRCYLNLRGIHSLQLINLNHGPVMYSYPQIREFASRARGKMGSKTGKGKKMQLTNEEMAEVIDIDDYRQQLNNIAEKLKKEYVDNLSIRSAVGNIENIIVKIDGEEYQLNELAVISKKNPTLITINMVEFPEGLKPVMQAITESGSGFNPQQDGTMIYVTIPKMTREHRETLAKNAKTLYMKAKDEIRSVQNFFIKDAKGKTELSEDLIFNTTNQIKMLADQCGADLEKILKVKQNELLGES